MKKALLAIFAVLALSACDNTAELSPAASEADLVAAVEEIKAAC